MNLAQRRFFHAAQLLSAAAPSLIDIGGGCEHEEGCLLYTRLALVPYLQNGAESSLPLWQKAFALANKVQGPWHVATAMSGSNLGQIYLELGKVDLAEPLITKALEVLSTLPPTEDEGELSWRAQVSTDTGQALQKLTAAKGASPEATKIPEPAEATPIE